MYVLTAVCMLVAGVAATSVYDYANISPYDIKALLERLERVSEFEDQVAQQLNNATDNANSVFNLLEDINNTTLNDIRKKEAEQDKRLQDIFKRIKQDALRAAAVIARVEGADAQAKFNLEQLTRLQARIAELTKVNVQEDADLEDVAVTLNNSIATVRKSIKFNSNDAEAELERLEAAIDDTVNLIDTRFCVSGETVVEFFGKQNVAAGTISIPDGLFTGTPQVYCSIQGYKSKLNLDRSEVCIPKRVSTL